MNNLTSVIEQFIPRILTQVCRDPSSDSYGAFDRHWWHYKIRDFPSIIIQQGGYALFLASKLDGYKQYEKELHSIAKASCLFWQERAIKHNAFEEYYPWEQGYPPLAFSTLGVLHLVDENVINKNLLLPAISIAARQLQERFESQAANQQVAGLAALALIKKHYPEKVNTATFESLVNKTAALQTKEGWFIEYDGPDLGYLSVTIDCLWDLFDATLDQRFENMANSALDFMGACILCTERSLGMLQSRNTDYIVPYGIARFIASNSSKSELAKQIYTILFKDIDSPTHAIKAVDERYLCHYIGHSFLRAHALLKEDVSSKAELSPHQRTFKQAGLFLSKNKKYNLIIALNKGGVFTMTNHDQSASDYGWIVNYKNKQYVNHWWMPSNFTWQEQENKIIIHGNLIKTQEEISMTWKHIVLRGLSFVLGRRLISILKNQLIFKKNASPFKFSREIILHEKHIEVNDTISNIPKDVEAFAAPRTSKRHVASADSFHQEDLSLTNNIKKKQTSTINNKQFIAQTYYHLEDTAS